MQRCLMMFLVNVLLLNAVRAADDVNPAALTADDVEKAVTYLNTGIKESKNGAMKREFRKLLASLETPDPKARVDFRQFPSISPVTPTEGQIGSLALRSYYVSQVISEDEMLVRINISRGESRFFKLCDSTKGLVDDQLLKDQISGAYVVTGTETYKTAVGATNTVWVLKKFDIEKASAALKAGQKKSPANKDGEKPKKP